MTLIPSAPLSVSFYVIAGELGAVEPLATFNIVLLSTAGAGTKIRHFLHFSFLATNDEQLCMVPSIFTDITKDTMSI